MNVIEKIVVVVLSTMVDSWDAQNAAHATRYVLTRMGF